MKIINKYLNREYEILEKYEAGIALTGAEVKSIRKGSIHFKDAYVKLLDNGAVLINAEISRYYFAPDKNYDPRRTRELLLHQKEIIRLKTKLAQGGQLTIVPVSCYTKGHLLKLEIGLARGKKTWERKKVDKERDIQRQTEKEIKEYTKVKSL